MKTKNHNELLSMWKQRAWIKENQDSSIKEKTDSEMSFVKLPRKAGIEPETRVLSSSLGKI